MFNFSFFKKNTSNTEPPTPTVETPTVEEDTGTPFEVPVPDLQALYNLSVQKTAEDFRTVDNKDFTFDSADGNVKAIKNSYEADFLGQEIIYTYFAKQGFIGFNGCAILAQDWLIQKAISAPCDDAIAVNYDITIKDKEITDEDKTVIDEMKLISDDNTKFNIKNICKTFAENKRKYGQALCIPIVEGANRELPFNIDSIRPNTYKGMSVIEPVWVTPVLDIEATTNPASPRFYQPTWFKMPNGDLIHYTWFIFNIYGNLADILKPTYQFGGIPLPQLLYEQTYAAHKTAKEAPMLAQSKRLNYMQGNLNAYSGNSEMLNKDVNMLTYLRNNWGWLFIKKDQSIGQLDTSLTDFDAVTMLGYQIVSAISGVIAPRLLETSPKGWQSNGSYEADSYKRMQQSIQRLDFCPILDFHYRLLAKSKYNIDNCYSVVFDAIDTPTEKEMAEIRETNSRTDMNYIQAGVISPEEIRGVLREDVKSGYNALAEEMEGQEEQDLFGSENDTEENPEKLGGSSKEQSPFNLDDWEEEKHPRDKGGKFSASNTNGNIEKSRLSDKIKSKERKALNLPKEEYANIVHELNTNLSKEQRKKDTIVKCIGNYRYTIINKGFNEYTIIQKVNIDDID